MIPECFKSALNKRAIFILIGTMADISSLNASFFPEYVYSQLIRPSDPRVTGMGLGGTALAGDVGSIWINPSGLGSISCPQGLYSYGPGSPTLNGALFQHSGAAAWPAGHGAMAITFTQIGYSTGDQEGKSGLDAGFWTFGTGIGRRWSLFDSGNFFFGGSVRYIRQRYGLTRIQGVLGDAGLQYSMRISFMKWRVGGSIHNLGPLLNVRTGDDDWTLSAWEADPFRFFRIGISAEGYWDREDGHHWCVSAEYQKEVFQSTPSWRKLSLGSELVFFDILSGTLGYLFNLESQDPTESHGLTFSFGARTPEPIFEEWPFIVEFRYAHGLTYGNLLSESVYGIRLKFEPSPLFQNK